MAAEIEPAAFRRALGSFATGVTIVTTKFEDEHYGVTANSFSSVSLRPPLILWSLAKSSASLGAFANAPSFAVHILGSDQQALSNRFATKGIAKFADLTFDVSEGGVPLLPDCAARLECRTTYQYEGGDHIIFVGEVVNFAHEDKDPLLFHAGRYAATAPAAAGAADQNFDLGADDLTNLVANAYYQLLSPVRARAAGAGLALADHYALSALLARGDISIADINGIIGHMGLSVDASSIESLRVRGLVAIAHGDAADAPIALTDVGRAQMIELIAVAKAREADAQLRFADEDAHQIKGLLRRLIEGLEGQGDGDRISQHMQLMKAVTRG